MRSVSGRNVVMRRIPVICIHFLKTFRSPEFPHKPLIVGRELFFTAETEVEKEESKELVHASTTLIPEVPIHCCSLCVMVSVRHAVGGTL